MAAAASAGHRVIPIAGPSAFLLALVASGLPSSKFTFVGFLPDKAKHRQHELQALAGTCLGAVTAKHISHMTWQHVQRFADYHLGLHRPLMLDAPGL